MLISRRAIDEFLHRELDDFRWMKKLTRDQIMREINGLKLPPRFKSNPWLHQLVCFYIGRLYPRFLFLLDMGAGKTKIIADLITQYQREGKLDRALVTVPRKINISSWRDDLEKHSDLEPTLIDCEDIEEKFERLLKAKGDVTVIDLHGLVLAMCKKDKRKGRMDWEEKKVKWLLQRYNFLGIDEIHKLKSHDNLWFMLVDKISRGMDFAYGATGTIFGKRVEDVWAPFFLIDRGETFGENLGPFKAAFFDVKLSAWKQEYVFRKDMTSNLHRMLQHRSIRYEEGELQDLPKLTPYKRPLEMGEEQREHYLRALEGLISAGGKLRELEAQYIRMRQIVSGYLAWKDDAGDHVLFFKDNPKLDATEAYIDEMGDSKIVIVYWYTHTGRMIVERVKSMGIGVEWLYGGTKDHDALRKRFMEDPNCRVLVMQADAGGTGNDGLQKVARYMIMYETPTSPTDRKQVIKRLHRPGQTRRCVLYDLMMLRSLDVGILEDIEAGIDAFESIVNGNHRGKGFFLGA